MRSSQKILKAAALKRHIRRLKRCGRRIAFTNGCFDILHYGHVSYLEAAKRKDRVLVVGLNSDRSVRRLKGPHRPIQPEAARARVLAALHAVDYVTVFDEDTPLRLIRLLEPDILIKGADWRKKSIAGAEVVRQHGGKVELIPYVPGFSSTRIIESVRGRILAEGRRPASPRGRG